MNLTKVGQVASREFLATVSTRMFVIGLLLVPAMLAFVFAVMPRLMGSRGGRPISGQVLVFDETGRAGDAITQAFSAEALNKRRDAAARQVQAQLPDSMRGFAGPGVDGLLGDVPNLTIEPRSGPFALDDARQWLLDAAATPRHLAVVAVERNALDAAADGEYGGYALYVPPNGDSRLENTIYDGVRDALISVRGGTHGVDVAALQSMLRVNRARSVTVSATGERTTDVTFSRALPFAFLMLMMMGVMIGGQGLLTTTIEEKSSRVVEVLLAAVSPLELMVGKLLGYMAVSLLAMSVYIGLGVLALTSFAMLGLVNLSLIVYLVVFFLVAYLLNGAMMMAIGAAVNDLREAQSLMMPVTLMVMLPWIMSAPILQNPSSPFAVAMSFIPPVNTFAMLLRLSSTAPPPAWQAWLTAVIGLVAAGIAITAAAKIYRIGLLMYGKPPNFATLMRWVRAA